MRTAWLALLLLGPGCAKPAPQPQVQAAPPTQNDMRSEGMNAPAPAPVPDEPPSPLGGIWEGRLGTQPVRACFSVEGSFGGYFTLTRLRFVGLDGVAGSEDSFSEGTTQGAPVWRNVQATGAVLTATRTSGREMLPVRLRRVAAATVGGDTGPCSSFAFHRPRMTGIRIVHTRGQVDGTAYTKLTLDTRGHFDIRFNTFALDGGGAAVRRINAELGEGLSGNPPGWFFCINNSLVMFPGEGESDEALEPVMISRRWLSVAHRGTVFCGGAHPDGYVMHQLFDRSSGAAVELLNWFRPTAVKHERVTGMEEDYLTVQPAFRAFLLAGQRLENDADGECARVLRDQDRWNAGMTRTGIVFIPELPHVVQACSRDITIPFDRIRPWLKPEGAAAVAALQAERRSGYFTRCRARLCRRASSASLRRRSALSREK